jgi:hypothetical protein
MKSGKFLRPRHAAVDRQSALRHAVLLVAVHRAKIRRTLERRHIARPVGVEQQPETGEAKIRRQLARIDAASAVVEHGRVIGQFLRASVLDAVQPHRFGHREPEMEESRLEPDAIARPQRVIVAKADRLPLVPAELGDRCRQHDVRRLVRRRGHRSRQALESGVVERLGAAETLQRRGGCDRCRCSQPAVSRAARRRPLPLRIEKPTSRHALRTSS